MPLVAGVDSSTQSCKVVIRDLATGALVRWCAPVARVAAVALPHDWLTWRLHGFGPVGESPLGPVLEELTTDRSEASGTAYWNPAASSYDNELFERALGHAAVLPRVLGPAETAGTTAATPGSRVPAGIVVAPGDVVVSIGTSAPCSQ